MIDSGVALPFHELPAEKKAELLGWLREQEERKRLVDPVGYFWLQYPDGMPMNHDVYEMHLSQAVELNEQKIFLYLASERNRSAKLAEWKVKVKQAEAQANSEFKRVKERAAAAAICDLPLPDSKQAWDLLEFRRSHVAEVTRPESIVIPPPNIPYTPADALWIRTVSSGAVITMPNTLRCNHD